MYKNKFTYLSALWLLIGGLLATGCTNTNNQSALGIQEQDTEAQAPTAEDGLKQAKELLAKLEKCDTLQKAYSMANGDLLASLDVKEADKSNIPVSQEVKKIKLVHGVLAKPEIKEAKETYKKAHKELMDTMKLIIDKAKRGERLTDEDQNKLNKAVNNLKATIEPINKRIHEEVAADHRIMIKDIKQASDAKDWNEFLEMCLKNNNATDKQKKRAQTNSQLKNRFSLMQSALKGAYTQKIIQDAEQGIKLEDASNQHLQKQYDQLRKLVEDVITTTFAPKKSFELIIGSPARHPAVETAGTLVAGAIVITLLVLLV